MAKPEQDIEVNARKSRVDELAGELLGMDKKAVRRMAEEICKYLPSAVKLSITGPTGSSKTTVGKAISALLEIPSFDLDEYIPGGWTNDPVEYQKRFSEGMGNLWEDLPWTNSWVIEHVESASPNFLSMFRPTYALYLNPGQEQLQAVVKARQAYGNYDKGTLEHRLAETSTKAFQQFRSAPGEVITRGRGWELKTIKP